LSWLRTPERAGEQVELGEWERLVVVGRDARVSWGSRMDRAGAFTTPTDWAGLDLTTCGLVMAGNEMAAGFVVYAGGRKAWMAVILSLESRSRWVVILHDTIRRLGSSLLLGNVEFEADDDNSADGKRNGIPFQ